MTTPSLVRAPLFPEGMSPATALAAPLTAAGREPGRVLDAIGAGYRMTGDTGHFNG